MAWVHYFAGRYHDAIKDSDQAIALDPGFPIAYATLGLAAAELGSFELAIDSLKTAAKLGGYPPEVSPELGYVFGRAGRLAEAKEMYTFCEKDPEHLKLSESFHCALLAVGLDELEQATDWLYRAKEDRVWMMQLAVDPRFGQLHERPRFQQLLAELDLQPAFRAKHPQPSTAL
jgi:tetratricopeptide (TPR) repeat protein